MYCLYILKYFLSYVFYYSILSLVRLFFHSLTQWFQLIFFVYHMHIFPCLKPPIPVHTCRSSPSRVESIPSPWIWLACDLLSRTECGKSAPCWPKAWALRNLTTSAFALLRAPSHYVKNFNLPIGEKMRQLRHQTWESSIIDPQAPVTPSQPTPLGADTSSLHPGLPTLQNRSKGMVLLF